MKYVYSQNVDFDILFSGKFTQFNMPLLEELGNVFIELRINTLTFPNLKKVNHWDEEDAYFIQNLNLPKLAICNKFQIIQPPYISPTINNPTINLPLLTSCNNFTLENISLNSSQVNAFLHQFLNITPINGKYINLMQYSQPAPPTGTGIEDKNTLIAQGNTVLTN